MSIMKHYRLYKLQIESLLFQVGKEVCLELNAAFMKKLEEEDKFGRSKPVCGFLR